MGSVYLCQCGVSVSSLPVLDVGDADLDTIDVTEIGGEGGSRSCFAGSAAVLGKALI